MISYPEFKRLMIDLSIATGKNVTAFGKKATDDEQLDYMLNVFHKNLRHNDNGDIVAAFEDKRLRHEISEGYNLSVDVIEKYIQNHRSKRLYEENGGGQEIPFSKGVPTDCVEKLKSIGIDIAKIAEDKGME